MATASDRLEAPSFSKTADSGREDVHLAVGQLGQVVRFEFSNRTKKGKTQHGRRADVVFVE